MAATAADFASAEAEPTWLGRDPMRRRQRRMKRNLPGPAGLAWGGASAVLRGLAVALATSCAARLASAPSPSQRGSRGILRQAPKHAAAALTAVHQLYDGLGVPVRRIHGPVLLAAVSCALRHSAQLGALLVLDARTSLRPLFRRRRARTHSAGQSHHHEQPHLRLGNGGAI